MHKNLNQFIHTLFIFITILFSTLTVGLAVNHAEKKKQNPFTPKALVIRYWDRVIKNNLPKPSFILSKASPLSALEAVAFEKYAAANTLTTKLPEFCSAAHLICLLDINPQSCRKSIFKGLGTDSFKGYGKRVDLDKKIHFKSYGVTAPFEDYAKGGIMFGTYTKSFSGSLVKRLVQPGNFFRERMLKKGMVMLMPDIRDKLPQRSFLPRSILTKLPFDSFKLNELKQIFNVSNHCPTEKIMVDSMRECERAPSKGETKRCVGSLEDMIDFATFVLGRNVTVRSIENVSGSNNNVMIGQVRGVNGGKVTQSVSCHQSLFPYLLYYCHSVPKVRIYEVDLLDPKSNVKINHGIVICHLDTTAWSPTHDAFMALGYGPGRIEVCHWIFENDMTWTTAN